MKIAITFFFLAAIWVFAFPFSMAKINYEKYQTDGIEAEWVKKDLARYTDVVTPSKNIIEKTTNVGYMNKLNVSTGFKLIHDSSLGQEAVFTGPDNVLEHISLMSFSITDQKGLFFNKPIKLTEPVLVRMNLNNHHVGNFSLFFNSSSMNNWDNFETQGPLEGSYLWIAGAIRSSQAIELDVARLDFSQSDRRSNEQSASNIIEFKGQAGEVNLPNNRTESIVLDQLEADVFRQYYEAMNGRKLSFKNIDNLKVLYDSDVSFNVSGEVIELIPDTFIIGPNTQIKIEFRDGERTNSFVEGFIIRE